MFINNVELFVQCMKTCINELQVSKINFEKFSFAKKDTLWGDEEQDEKDKEIED